MTEFQFYKTIWKGRYTRSHFYQYFFIITGILFFFFLVSLLNIASEIYGDPVELFRNGELWIVGLKNYKRFVYYLLLFPGFIWRLHDVGMNTWLAILFLLVPGLNLFAIGSALFEKGEMESNKYGPCPYQIEGVEVIEEKEN